MVKMITVFKASGTFVLNIPTYIMSTCFYCNFVIVFFRFSTLTACSSSMFLSGPFHSKFYSLTFCECF